jgi:hypothetical protein
MATHVVKGRLQAHISVVPVITIYVMLETSLYQRNVFIFLPICREILRNYCLGCVVEPRAPTLLKLITVFKESNVQ